MNKYISTIDTNRFGFKIAKVNTFNNNPIELINELKNQGVKLIISRINVLDLDLINSLERIGFEMKDVQLSYNINLRSDANYVEIEKHKFIIRDSKIEDAEQISDLARQSFKGYGHYSADKRLDYKKSTEVYADWAKNTCLDKNAADKVIVAEDNGIILAFGSYKILEDSIGKYAKGIIGAVLPEYQKMGFLKIISLKSMDWAVKNGLKRFQHTVLSTNYGMNSAYTKFGYTLFKSEITFHYWFDN
ncbi:MAG: GNAT family N-acetyltransferase [Bacteroidales bacterium]|nr:GNAT family N-acetyltransferase [Bacteroidales bacterium]MBN2757953.1 GNAT family N-acetyltransferase [Bacteroidales bacterium]